MFSKKSTIQNQKKSGRNPSNNNINKKVFMISLPNTSTNPWTVMIMNRNTNITNVTMKDSWSFDYHAGRTLFANYFFFVLGVFTSVTSSAFWNLRIWIGIIWSNVACCVLYGVYRWNDRFSSVYQIFNLNTQVLNSLLFFITSTSSFILCIFFICINILCCSLQRLKQQSLIK